MTCTYAPFFSGEFFFFFNVTIIVLEILIEPLLPLSMHLEAQETSKVGEGVFVQVKTYFKSRILSSLINRQNPNKDFLFFGGGGRLLKI